ncbi:MAG TPA: 1,4-dihydroxy-2-naphthoate polyprenyltransferase [Cyclobacteriaceae bacterium]|nr:1,4-dihydroxy-2-naphthoate polyprenyltransferase [Cyclobacteriaceae bacterium]
MKIQAWIKAIRLRTLPLALSSIAMGSFLAAFDGAFSFRILLFSGLTTIFLQILSNLANDYGDYIHGADGSHRSGPSRAVSSGTISPGEMKTAIIIFAVASFASGMLLIYNLLNTTKFLFFIFLAAGILAILSAIGYTMGKKPYGYAGLGDLFVVLFFGITGVAGTYFLHTGQMAADSLLPALGTGFFATAVLNINNIRDIESDRLSGKRSIPVRIGLRKAVFYHWFLLAGGWSTAIIFTVLNFRGIMQFLFLLATPLLILNGIDVAAKAGSDKLDACLKKMAMTTLVFVITFGIGLMIVRI